MCKPLISVITVCLNAEEHIENTIKSILNQDCTDYEYLIIDGLSEDSTVDIAGKYSEHFSDKGISFKIISEKDNGVYDAMNKAAGYAQGEWIIYINAGDMLFDECVLKKLSSEISDDADVVYGDAALLENGKYKMLISKPVDAFKTGNPICHQASITKADVIRDNPFDTGYKIASDYDQFLKMYLSGKTRFKKINFTFCYYLLGGLSSNVLKREMEFAVSRTKNGMKKSLLSNLKILKRVFIDTIRSAAILILGQKFYSNRRGWCDV